jgi:hypothetical protein
VSWPSPPYPFATATSPEPMASLDTMFNQVGAMLAIPCTPSGTNAIALTPNVNCPALSSYNELGGYRFVALGTSTGLVTAQYNGLGFLPVYHGDGVTQASTADIVLGQQYVFRFHAALNGGLGGFYFESPSQPVPIASWYTPGGRLTTNPGVPVNFTTNVGTGLIYYSPYIHPFVPLFNGSTVQMYQFAASLSDHVGLTINLNGNAAWPAGNVFDIFVILNAGVLTLATLQWANLTTRAMALSIFGGFLTNAGATNMLTAPAGTPVTVAVAANQATFLGSFYTTANGIVQWAFPGSNNSGTFGLSNYYNRALFTGNVVDSVSYTYSSATVRQAGGHAYNQITVLQTSSERALSFTAITLVQNAAVAGSYGLVGLGVNNTTAYAVSQLRQTPSAVATQGGIIVPITISFTGFFTVSVNQNADGTNATTFNSGTSDQLQFTAWL